MVAFAESSYMGILPPSAPPAGKLRDERSPRRKNQILSVENLPGAFRALFCQMPLR